MNLVKLLAFFVGAMIFAQPTSVSAETWKDLLNRADSLSKARNQDSAIFIGKMALEKTQAEFGGDDTASARVLYQLGADYYYKTAYDQADTLFHQALAIRERVLGPNHPDVATSLNSLATLDHDQARYADAEPLYKRALAIREKALGPDHPHVAFSLNNLAALYDDQARYADAEPLYKRALAIREKTLGPDHPDVARSLSNLALLYYSDQARYTEAEPLYERALAIMEQALGPEHPDVATSLSNLAAVYRDQARYADAEPLFKRALAIWEKALGPDHPDVATSLNNLANVYYDQARYADAEPIYKRALAIWEKALGPDHPLVATSLSNLALVYYDQARYADAEPLCKRALAIREQVLGPDHPDVAWSLNNIAGDYLDQARYAEAEPLYKRALAIREKALGPDHPDVAASLNGLANVYSDQARYADANPLYKRELAILEKALGPNHPHVAFSLNNLATDYRATGQSGLGIAEATRAFNILLRNFSDNAFVLSEKDALSYSQLVRKSSRNYLSCYVDIGTVNPEQSNQGCTVVFESKGIVSVGVMERQQALATEKDSVTLDLVASLRNARLQISKLYSAGPGDDTTGAYKKELDSLAGVANNLEAGLSRRSSSFQRRQDLKNITVARIESVLPANSSLVEYLKWDYQQIKPDSLIPRYLALIVDKGGKPEIVNLGDASEIEPLIDRYLKHMRRVSSAGRQPDAADMAEYRPLGKALYEKIWKPLERHFKEGQTIFVGLDGSLNLVSLAGLMDEKETYLAETYVIHHLSSGKDLIRLQDSPAQATGLFALGNPDYDATPSSRRSSEVFAQKGDSVAGGSVYATRNVRSGCGDLKDLQVQPLPGTRSEIYQIVSRWHAASPETVAVFLGSQASEDNFKKDAPGKRVIHLATHGYYLEGQCQPSVLSTRRSSAETWVGENPLLLSGLLLAGANLHGNGADSLGVDDGILSAYEVSSLNLEGTRLVVLSACETGLGEVKAGEGVYGLRRAFQMAGARTVISSLWPVPDQATADMMSQLYSQSNRSLPERLRDQQLAQIKKLRASGSPDHPYSWAAFIALGDWR